MNVRLTRQERLARKQILNQLEDPAFGNEAHKSRLRNELWKIQEQALNRAKVRESQKPKALPLPEVGTEISQLSDAAIIEAFHKETFIAVLSSGSQKEAHEEKAKGLYSEIMSRDSLPKVHRVDNGFMDHHNRPFTILETPHFRLPELDVIAGRPASEVTFVGSFRKRIEQ